MYAIRSYYVVERHGRLDPGNGLLQALELQGFDRLARKSFEFVIPDHGMLPIREKGFKGRPAPTRTP